MISGKIKDWEGELNPLKKNLSTLEKNWEAQSGELF